MYEDVRGRLKKKNKILFTRDSVCLQSFIKLLQEQDHKTIVLWAFEQVKPIVQDLKEKYPEEIRPEQALELSQKWARGEIKMPEAKRAILNCHKVCKEIEDEADIARCHAVGQGVSSVHVETHAIGLCFYELTALVWENQKDFEDIVNKKIKEYEKSLLVCKKLSQDRSVKWADFLLKKDVVNKELKLAEKRKQN